jgi:hypothetical protein
MLIARAPAVLLYAAAGVLLGACSTTAGSPEATPGVSLAGNWKLDPAASDDPQKILAEMRTQATKIINRNIAYAQAHGNASNDVPDEAASAHGPRRDPLQRSPMAHIIRATVARGDYLTVLQKPAEIVFDYGSSRRSFTPGVRSVVSAEGGVGDQSSGWKGREYVIVIQPQMGPRVVETYTLSADGRQLADKLKISSYELPAVSLTRVYNATSETAPRQLPTD